MTGVPLWIRCLQALQCLIGLVLVYGAYYHFQAATTLQYEPTFCHVVDGSTLYSGLTGYSCEVTTDLSGSRKFSMLFGKEYDSCYSQPCYLTSKDGRDIGAELYSARVHYAVAGLLTCIAAVWFSMVLGPAFASALEQTSEDHYYLHA